MKLKGKSAVVTGGTRGLGRAIAEEFLAEGARVVVASRQEGAAWELAARWGDAVGFREVDVRDPGSVASLMGAAAEQLDGLDIVVANAGVSRPGPVAALAAENWTQVLATNVTGVFHCVQAAVPHLAASGAGRLITLSSALAVRPTPGAVSYCASKAAVEALTRVAALELAARGITANCLSPGFIDEGMGRELAQNETVWPLFRDKLAMGRLGYADEVARAAVFLAGDDSSYVNGHVLEVSGGLTW